jgi:hypothetical protein
VTIVWLFDIFSTTLAGVEAVLTTALLGQPYTLTVLVPTGAGLVPVEVELDPELEFVPQAVSMKASAVTSEIINHNDFRLSI